MIFSKYDVEVYIGNSHLGTVEHGTTETFTKSLTKGTYEVKFVDSDDEDVLGTVDIEVQQNETFKYKISCTSSEIIVKAVTDTIETESEEQTVSEIVQDDSEAIETTAETEMLVIETEFGSETQVKEKESETITKETEGSSISDTQIEETESVNETQEDNNNAITYSTNTVDTVGNGNSGIYAYKSSGGSYYTYWIIDFDAGCVYTFMEGNGESSCDRLQIDSGDLNTGLTITYHDDGYTWSYSLYFKYKNEPEHLVMKDNDGFDYDYYATNLDSALQIRDKKTIKDY